MKISIYCDGKTHYFTNEGLKVGDKVWPLTFGENRNGEYFVIAVTPQHFTPDDPHIIQNLAHSDTKSYQVRTNHGYGPIEGYFKLIG